MKIVRAPRYFPTFEFPDEFPREYPEEPGEWIWMGERGFVYRRRITPEERKLIELGDIDLVTWVLDKNDLPREKRKRKQK
jgi:hypothetical protein